MGPTPSSPARDRSFCLQDGKRLEYADFGPRGGKPLLYFHGFPSCRLEGALAAPAAAKLGLRLIAPDRPGFGGSDLQPKRTLADWPGQVVELADALGLERFAVLGISGGGPYAAACALQIPDRLTEAVLVCPQGPVTDPQLLREMPALNRAFFRLFRHVPQAGQLLFRLLARQLRKSPEKILKILTAGAPPPDQEVLQLPRPREVLLASYREAMRQGVRGGLRELEIFSRPWNISLHRACVPVDVWHGGRDNTVPWILGKTLSDLLGARWHFLPDEGHFSLPLRHMEQILASASSEDFRRATEITEPENSPEGPFQGGAP